MHAAPFLRARCGHAIFSTTRPDDSRRCSSCNASTARSTTSTCENVHANFPEPPHAHRWSNRCAHGFRLALGIISHVHAHRINHHIHAGTIRQLHHAFAQVLIPVVYTTPCEAPRSAARESFAALPAAAITSAPSWRPNSTVARPTPPAAPSTNSLSPDASSPRLCSAIIAILYAIGNAAALTKSKSSGMRTHVAACTATRSANPPW